MPSKSKKADTSIVPKKYTLKPTFPTPKPPGKSSTEFPVVQYTSLVGTQSLLLLFSALYLPRSSSSLFGPGFLEERRLKKTSLDRPEHPFLVELTDWPEVTMGWICAGTILVTVWWAGYVREWKNLGKKNHEEIQDDDKAKQTPALSPPVTTPSSEKMKALKEAWLATVCGVPCFYFLAVLFGAPINSHFTSTALLSALLATLTIYTPVYSLGFPSLLGSESKDVFDRLTYVRLFSEFFPRTAFESSLVYPAIGCLLGCGIGAFPIPLDWDRPWQAWPLTPAFGAIVGYILGSMYSVVLTTAAQTIDNKTE